MAKSKKKSKSAVSAKKGGSKSVNSKTNPIETTDRRASSRIKKPRSFYQSDYRRFSKRIDKHSPSPVSTGVEVEPEPESPAYERFDERSPFADEIESNEIHADGGLQNTKNVDNFQSALEGRVDVKKRLRNAAECNPVLALSAPDTHDPDDADKAAELDGSGGDELPDSLESEHISDTEIMEAQNECQNPKLDLQDSVEVARTFWSSLFSRNNYLRIIQNMEYKHRLSIRGFKRHFTRYRMKLSSIMHKQQTIIESYQKLLKPMEENQAMLVGLRAKEMEAMDSQATKQVSEELLKYQDYIRQFSEQNTVAEKVLRTELHQKQSDLTLARLRRKLKSATLERKLENEAVRQREIPETVSQSPLSPATEDVEAMPQTEDFSQSEHVETISNYDSTEDDEQNQHDDAYQEEEYQLTEAEDEGASLPMDLDQTPAVYNDVKQTHVNGIGGESEEHFATHNASPDYAEEIDVEGSVRDFSGCETQKLTAVIEEDENEEMEVQQSSPALIFDSTKDEEEPNDEAFCPSENDGNTNLMAQRLVSDVDEDHEIESSHPGHGLSASETDLEVEPEASDKKTPSPSAPLKNINPAWASSNLALSQSETDTDADSGTARAPALLSPTKTTFEEEGTHAAQPPLFSNSEVEPESAVDETETQAEIAVSKKLKPLESGSDAGRKVVQKYPCKSGTSTKRGSSAMVGPTVLREYIDSSESDRKGSSKPKFHGAFSGNSEERAKATSKTYTQRHVKNKKKPAKKDAESSPQFLKKLPNMTGFKNHLDLVLENSESETEGNKRNRLFNVQDSSQQNKNRSALEIIGLGNNKKRANIPGSPLFLKSPVTAKFEIKKLRKSAVNFPPPPPSASTSESEFEAMKRKASQRKSRGVKSPDPEAVFDAPEKSTSPSGKGTASPGPPNSAKKPSPADSHGRESRTSPSSTPNPQHQMPYQQQWANAFGQAQGLGSSYYDMYRFNPMMMNPMYPPSGQGFNPAGFMSGMGQGFQGAFPPPMGAQYAQGMSNFHQHGQSAPTGKVQEQGADSGGIGNNFQQSGVSGVPINNYQQPGMNPYFAGGMNLNFQQGASGGMGMNSNFPQGAAGGMNPNFMPGAGGMSFPHMGTKNDLANGGEGSEDKKSPTASTFPGIGHGFNPNFQSQAPVPPVVHPFHQQQPGPMPGIGMGFYPQAAGAMGMGMFPTGVPNQMGMGQAQTKSDSKRSGKADFSSDDSDSQSER